MKLYIGLICVALLAIAVIAGCPRQKPADSTQSASGDQSINQAAGETAPGTPDADQIPPEGQANAANTTAAGATTTPPNASVPATGASTGSTGTTVNGDIVQVAIETTKGPILLAVHPEWAPIGAAHFIELVNAKFYDGAPWFRVLDGFVAQCGVAADPKMNETWAAKTINDEPVVTGNKPGMVAFGQSPAPNSRSTHWFINMVDNSGGLDGQGFACFAEVVKGMDVVAQLTKCEFADQGVLAGPGGMDAFKKQFPNADYITQAFVIK
jgi:peptidyl-prolyl cis-trans isomerase A (cyclophilin A)